MTKTNKKKNYFIKTMVVTASVFTVRLMVDGGCTKKL